MGTSLYSRAVLPAALGSVWLMATADNAYAGGFLLQEQSQKEIGRAFSGSAASADSPSTIYYNPAGMTELDGLQMSTGVTALFVDSGQRNIGSTISDYSPTAYTVTGGDGGNPFATATPVPASYASWQVGNSGVWLGLGISSPFGLKLRYEPDFFGRYESLYSKLLTINAQPSFAYKLSDSVSIGGGVDIQYADATLTSARPSATPGGTDGYIRMSGDDVSVGWNVGILAKLNGGTRVGLHYRSRVKHELKGEYATGLGSTNVTRPIVSPITMPDIVTAGISAPIGEGTRLMVTGRYYNWSVFQRILIVFGDGSTGERDYHYRDSWSVAAGIDRQIGDRLTLRAGTMFDKTPTNSQFLSTRVPDGDRTWASAGLSYRLNDHLTLNASYAHVFINGQTMVRPDNFSIGTGAVTVTTRSRQSGNVDMIATSVSARF